MATLAKHSHLDSARSLVAAVQRSFARLQRELEDVGREMRLPDLEIAGTLEFADYFFDGLVVDWMVQGRITKGRERAEGALRVVKRVRTRLAGVRRRLDEELTSVCSERDSFVAESR